MKLLRQYVRGLLKENTVQLGSYTVNILPSVANARESPATLTLDGVVDKGEVVPAQAQKLSNVMLVRAILDKLSGQRAGSIGDLTEALAGAMFPGSQNINDFFSRGNATFADIKFGTAYYSIKFTEPGAGALSAQGANYKKIEELAAQENLDDITFGIFHAFPSGDSLKMLTYGPLPKEEWAKVQKGKDFGVSNLAAAGITPSESILTVPSAADITAQLRKLKAYEGIDDPYQVFIDKVSTGENPLDVDQLRTVSGAYTKVGSNLAQDLGNFVTSAEDGTASDRVELGRNLNALQKTLRNSFKDGIPSTVDVEVLRKVIAALVKAENEADGADGDPTDDMIDFSGGA